MIMDFLVNSIKVTLAFYSLCSYLLVDSHSEANQSHPYNNNSLTDSEKISEIMHMAYLKGRGQGTEHSDGSAGIEFMSKEPSMIELSNKGNY